MRQNTPHIAVIFLHPGCNMTCTFCVTENTIDAMDFAQALRLLDFLNARGFDTVVFGGGEPFTWPHDLPKLAAEAQARGFFVQVGSNGAALPEDFAHIPSIDRYVFPLDAADAATHNRLRHYQDRHHDIIVDRLTRLRLAGKPVTISTVVTAVNVHALPGIADFLRAYRLSGGQVHAWHLYKFIPQGRGGAQNALDLDITEEVYQSACDEVKKLDPDFLIYKRRDMFHSRSVDFFWYEENAIQIGSEQWSKPPPPITA